MVAVILIIGILIGAALFFVILEVISSKGTKYTKKAMEEEVKKKIEEKKKKLEEKKKEREEEAIALEEAEESSGDVELEFEEEQ